MSVHEDQASFIVNNLARIACDIYMTPQRIPIPRWASEERLWRVTHDRGNLQSISAVSNTFWSGHLQGA